VLRFIVFSIGLQRDRLLERRPAVTPAQAELPETLETEGLLVALCVELRICELVELPELSCPTPALDTVPVTAAPTGLP
jgi:hypothetical protein